ncbi:EGF-like domain containing protein [Aphelenchoides avenae]|nr:EGF-like domain containing protein [Aphelenchus avenae]
MSALDRWWANCTWENGTCFDFLNATDCFNNGTCNGIVDKLPYTNTTWDDKLFVMPKCECLYGFEGNFCERRIPDPCAEVNGTRKCGTNGTCVRNNDTHSEEFTCKCDDGYEGIYCERRDPCYNTSCAAGSLCVPVPIGELEKDVTATCLCDLHQDVDPGSFNCKNASYAQCRNASVPGGLNCRHGAHCYPCELHSNGTVHTNDTVHRNGTGIDLCNDEERARGFRCICPLGFVEPFCDEPFTACTEHECQHGATCVLVNGTANSTVDDDLGYRCDCPPLYNGTFCENGPDACILHGNYCVNGQCVLDADWHQGFRCDCAEGYTGFHCDLAVETGFIVSFQANYEWAYPLATMILLIPFVAVVVAYNEVVYRTMRKPEAAEAVVEDGPQSTPDPAKEAPCDTGPLAPESTPPEPVPPVPTTPDDSSNQKDLASVTMSNEPIISVPALTPDEINVGELVLSLWRGKLYPAKIMQISGEKPHRQFKVHYVGYGKRYDHKVMEADLPDCIGKYIPTSKPANQQSAAADERHEDSPPAKRARVDPSAASEQPDSDSSHDDDEEALVELTNELEEIMVMDRDLIGRHGKLPKLPVRISVSQILERYILSLEAADFEVIDPDSDMPITKKELIEDAKELRGDFDDLLCPRLLYHSERAQYEGFVKERDWPASDIYGLPHLLRLVVFFDDFMLETGWDQHAVERIRKSMQHLVDYLGSEIHLDIHFGGDKDYEDAAGAGASEVDGEKETPDEKPL